MRSPRRIEIPRGLLEAARAGDPSALVGLLEAAEPDVRRYAERACASASDAEDAAQDALWLIYRRIGSLRALESFAAWAFAIVRRECRKWERRALLFFRGVESAARAVPDRPATKADLGLRLDLAEAIESLPEHYREVILLRDFQEMTINEIVAHLGLTRESAKARLHRARAMVRECLADRQDS